MDFPLKSDPKIAYIILFSTHNPFVLIYVKFVPVTDFLPDEKNGLFSGIGINCFMQTVCD